MDKREVKVKEEENRIRISVKGHSYVEVRKDTGEWVATERTNSEQVFIGLYPGNYVVETDGKIKSIKPEHFEIKIPEPK